MDPRSPVDPAVVVVGRADLHGQDLVGDRPCRGRAGDPGVEARAADFQQPAQRGDVVVGLLPVDEGEPRHLVDSVTKKAAAFFRISRSVLSLAFSRRSRVSSARSSPVSGSSPLLSGSPRSARSALTQLPNVVSLICRSRATSAIVLPVARTSSTACSRKSGENLLGRPIRTPSSGVVPKIRVSTEAGQLQLPPPRLRRRGFE